LVSVENDKPVARLTVPEAPQPQQPRRSGRACEKSCVS
jgi:hypothetical protein